MVRLRELGLVRKLQQKKRVLGEAERDAHRVGTFVGKAKDYCVDCSGIRIASIIQHSYSEHSADILRRCATKNFFSKCPSYAKITDILLVLQTTSDQINSEEAHRYQLFVKKYSSGEPHENACVPRSDDRLLYITRVWLSVSKRHCLRARPHLSLPGDC